MIYSKHEPQKNCKNLPFRQGLLWGFTALSFFISKPFGFFCLFLILLRSNEKYGFFGLPKQGTFVETNGENEPLSSQNQQMEWMLLELRTTQHSLQNKTLVAQLEHILSMAGQMFARQLLRDSGINAMEFLSFSVALTLQTTQAYCALECSDSPHGSLSQLEELMDLLVATFETQWDQLHTAQTLDFQQQKQVLESFASSCSVPCFLP